MSDALRAFAGGLRTVALAPLLVAGITLVTILSVIPFGLVLGSRLQTSLSQQQPVSAGATDIDPEWWMEYRAHAQGLEATFTPTIIGFAAPLDNLSALLDATPRPWALAGPIAFAALVWAFLWGGVLHRFAEGRSIGLRAFFAAGSRHAPRLALISALAVPVYLVTYLTIHRWLFGPIYNWLAGLVSTERDAFLCRLVLYALFMIVLVTIATVVDYSRIAVVTGRTRHPIEALRAGLRFVRARSSAVFGIYLLSGLTLAVMLAAYGGGEIYGGTRLGGWRAVLIGQAYIVGRLALRLVLAASEVRLYKADRIS